jgi:hypothetical protein
MGTNGNGSAATKLDATFFGLLFHPPHSKKPYPTKQVDTQIGNKKTRFYAGF